MLYYVKQLDRRVVAVRHAWVQTHSRHDLARGGGPQSPLCRSMDRPAGSVRAVMQLHQRTGACSHKLLALCRGFMIQIQSHLAIGHRRTRVVRSCMGSLDPSGCRPAMLTRFHLRTTAYSSNFEQIVETGGLHARPANGGASRRRHGPCFLSSSSWNGRWRLDPACLLSCVLQGLHLLLLVVLLPP